LSRSAAIAQQVVGVGYMLWVLSVPLAFSILVITVVHLIID